MPARAERLQARSAGQAGAHEGSFAAPFFLVADGRLGGLMALFQRRTAPSRKPFTKKVLVET